MNIEIGMCFGYIEPYDYIVMNNKTAQYNFGNRIKENWFSIFSYRRVEK